MQPQICWLREMIYGYRYRLARISYLASTTKLDTNNKSFLPRVREKGKNGSKASHNIDWSFKRFAKTFSVLLSDNIQFYFLSTVRIVSIFLNEWKIELMWAPPKILGCM